MRDLLIDPPGRQGPGPVGGPAVAALELALARRSDGLLPGDQRAGSIGSGTELSQLRPYVEGDAVRHLDAAASARTGEPHVRLHVPERSLTTWIVLDISASMAFGTTVRLKSDVAEGTVRTIARVGVRRGGRVALLRSGAAPGAVRILAPAGGRPALGAIDRALAEGIAADAVGSDAGGGGADSGGDGRGQDGAGRGGRGPAKPDGGPESLAATLGRLQRIARRPGLVTVVSDFRDGSAWERPLGVLAHQHRILAVEISDPREQELPDCGLVTMYDPETGEHVEVDTSSPRLRQAFSAAEAQRRADVHATLRRARARHVPLSTQDDWLRGLGRGLA